MENSKGIVPEIRYKGFTADWEQRKFIDFTFDAGEKNKNGLPLEPYAVTNGRGFIAQSEAHDDFGYMQNVDRTMYRIVKPNSFAYNPARINVGSIGYYDGAENVLVSSLYEVFQTVENVDDRFLWHWLKSRQFQDWIARLQEGSVRLYFYYDKLCQCHLMMPSLEEQKKIGAFFDSLDETITLHQRKLKKLQSLKASMLIKMFPQEGAKVPEIRFDGFDDAWEQRKLGDIGTIQTCKRIFKDQTSETGDIPFYKNGTLGKKADAYISREIFEEYKSLYPYPEVGDVLISAVGSVGRTAEYTGKDEYFQDSNVVWLRTDNNTINRKYLKTYYEVIDWLIEGSTVKHLYNDNILASKIWLPSLPEQEKIGAFFYSLDDAITLHQRKLEKLQQLKKSFLQKMFASTEE